MPVTKSVVETDSGAKFIHSCDKVVDNKGKCICSGDSLKILFMALRRCHDASNSNL